MEAKHLDAPEPKSPWTPAAVGKLIGLFIVLAAGGAVLNWGLKAISPERFDPQVRAEAKQRHDLALRKEGERAARAAAPGPLENIAAPTAK